MELSGVQFVSRFPGSRDTADLLEPFRANVERFLAALHTAGAAVHIQTTFRPAKRAYLMRFAFADALRLRHSEGQNRRWPSAPLRPGGHTRRPEQGAARHPVGAHRNAHGNPDLKASRKVAAAMVTAYGIVFGPAFPTRHSARRAIDMTITWSGPLKIADASGQIVTINTTPRTGADNKQIHAVGATCGVMKLVADHPHWSDNGH